MKATHIALIVAALTLSAPAPCQVSKPPQMTNAEKRAFDAADDLMQQCRLSMKAGRLALAEQQCDAAIQLFRSIGWRAQGETAVLGMIYYQQGARRLGFETIRDSWDGFHGSQEIELYLGGIAIELREYKTALEVVQRFRRGQAPVEVIPSTTRDFWPKGDDVKALQATLEFLEGERLCQTRETKDQGVKLLRHGDKLCPGNVAINFALAVELKDGKDPLVAAPFFRLVTERGSGRVKEVADEWLDKYRGELRQAALGGKGR